MIAIPTAKQERLPYTYAATVKRIVDGDTVDLLVDLGFDVHTRQRIRLLDVHAAERGEKDWSLHMCHLAALLPTGGEVTLVSHKVAATDKYGRYVGVIIRCSENVNELQARFIGVPAGKGVPVAP